MSDIQEKKTPAKPDRPPLITEKDGHQNGWYKDAQQQTLETLPAFLKNLTEEYEHDYRTICHAVTAAGLAAMHAVNKTPQGQLTQFQVGSIAWEFWRHWLKEQSPIKMVKFRNMLYPEFEPLFEKTITAATWTYLQKEASIELGRAEHNPKYNRAWVDHWKSIAKGKVPFGFKVLDAETGKPDGR